MYCHKRVKSYTCSTGHKYGPSPSQPCAPNISARHPRALSLTSSSSQLFRAQELCERAGGRTGLPVPNSPYGLCGRKVTLNSNVPELWSCVKVEVDDLGSPSLISLMVSVALKQHELQMPQEVSCVKFEVDVLGSPSLTDLTVSLDVMQHRTANVSELRSCVKVELDVLGFPSLIVCIRPLWT